MYIQKEQIMHCNPFIGNVIYPETLYRSSNCYNNIYKQFVNSITNSKTLKQAITFFL